MSYRKCTKTNCDRHIFSLTFCRTHYKKTYQTCYYCTKSVYAKRVCRTHYRHKQIPLSQLCLCSCSKPIFMKGKCLQHFLAAKCQICLQQNKFTLAWCKMLCQKHYMQQWRQTNQNGNSLSSPSHDDIINNPINEDTINTADVETKITELIQSSRSQPINISTQ